MLEHASFDLNGLNQTRILCTHMRTILKRKFALARFQLPLEFCISFFSKVNIYEIRVSNVTVPLLHTDSTHTVPLEHCYKEIK